MESLRLRVIRIADFGDVVCIQGCCEATGRSVALALDQRPHQALWTGWFAMGGVEPVLLEACSTVARLELVTDDEPGADEPVDPAPERDAA